MSVELNVYAHIRDGHMSPFIGVTVGVFIPFLVAILSHAAAHVNFHNALKFLVGAIVCDLMYVSASSGIRVLAPGLGISPAIAGSVGVDLAALTALGLLMYSASQKAALTEWEGRREAERRQAAQAAEDQALQDRINELTARQAGGNRGGNTPGNSGSNAVGGATGNTPPLPPAPPVPPALPPAAPPVTPGEDSTEEEGDGGTVTPFRRPALTDQEIRLLAEDMAGILEADGRQLSVRGFQDIHGGGTNRVTRILKTVNSSERTAARRAAAQRRAVGE
jgi:hypothetical protein